MTFKAKGLLGVTFFFLLFSTSFLRQAHSTHGMGTYAIEKFRFDPEKRMLYFENVFEDITAIYQYDLQKDYASLVDNPEHLHLDHQNLPYHKLKPLKQIDPKRFDFSLTKKFEGNLKEIFTPQGKKIPSLKEYGGAYTGPNMQKTCPYEISLKQGKRTLRKFNIKPCCLNYSGLNVRAYEIPQSQDLLFVFHYADNCWYYGMEGHDSLFLLRGIKKPKLKEKSDKVEPFKIPLREFKYSTILNNQGYKAYKNQQYEIAMEYFEAAFFSPNLPKNEQKTHFLALYNLAATEAKVGKNEEALNHLSLLLSHEKIKKKHLKKIKKDKDFDGLRTEEGFKSLIL